MIQHSINNNTKIIILHSIHIIAPSINRRLSTSLDHAPFQIPADNNSSDPQKAEQQVITCLTVSPSEENLICTTNINQMYGIALSSGDLNKVNTQCIISKPPKYRRL